MIKNHTHFEFMQFLLKKPPLSVNARVITSMTW